MNHKILKNGFSLPEIGLGTGGNQSIVSNDTEWKQAIQDALAIGYRHIDCAPMYANGRAEELVGEAIKGVERAELILSTKVSPAELAYDDAIASVQSSLSRLGVEYIDLLYIHAPNPNISLSETMRAMDTLVDRGIVKYLGVSNFNLELLIEAQSLTKNKIVANQIEYNLATREQSHFEGCDHMESKIIPYCQENDVLVVAYRPVDRGSILETNPLLDNLAEKYKKTKAQIAINWLISQDNIVTIPRSDSYSHLKENFEASGWYLDKEDNEFLKREYPTRG
ncbi:MAG: aldo/keto reductase [Patescibacteria group bacterium]